jgi:hypothetical protein
MDDDTSVSIHLKQEECWKPVPGYEVTYAVSNLGRVKRLTESCTRRRYPAGMILKPTCTKNGYSIVRLVSDRKKTFYVHRLVMAAFVGECPPGQEVNHINGQRSDNRLSNLEYVTRSENNLHAYQILGRQPHPTTGPKHHEWRVTDEQVRDIRLLHADGLSYAELGRQYGIDWSSVRDIVLHLTHKYVT